MEATGDAQVGAIVEARPFTGSDGRQRLSLATRSDLPLEAQVTSTGATWLDRNLVAREPPPLAQSGFGDEVRDALERRTEQLASEGLARRAGQRAVFARDLLDTLGRRELNTAAAKITAETGLPRQPATEGEHVAGIYCQRVQLASGRFAMIDNGLGFELVPWKPALGGTSRAASVRGRAARWRGGLDLRPQTRPRHLNQLRSLRARARYRAIRSMDTLRARDRLFFLPPLIEQG